MVAERTIEQLQEDHAEMLATAHDMGLDVPEELQAEFSEVAAGRAIVDNLDALIREKRGDGGKNVLAADDGEEHKGTAKKRPKKAKQKAPASESKPQETEVTEASKKAPTKKKVAKKTPAKKAAKKGAVGVSRFSDDAKITWMGKDNPAREGTSRFDKIETVRKHNGKTVKTYKAARDGKGGGTLSLCVKMGLAKVA